MYFDDGFLCVFPIGKGNVGSGSYREEENNADGDGSGFDEI